MDHPRPFLRIVNADDLDDSTVDFSKLAVTTPSGDKLGKVDGFIVDVDSGRPYYIVVDASGWFKTKHFLLPIGHAQLDSESDAVVADVPRERVKNFPGFDKGEIREAERGGPGAPGRRNVPGVLRHRRHGVGVGAAAL